jgi:hypothetical protein
MSARTTATDRRDSSESQFPCPACGVDLGGPAWDAGVPSLDICPSCGIQFGYNDARIDLQPQIYARWRELWLANGRRPLCPTPLLGELVPDAPPWPGFAEELEMRRGLTIPGGPHDLNRSPQEG